MTRGRNSPALACAARAAVLAPLLILWLVLLHGCGRGNDDPQSSADATTAAADSLLIRSSGAPARPAVLKPVAAAPRPSGPLPPGTSCVSAECHATFGTAPQIHAPVAERACDSCHAADIGGHRFPLKRSGSDSCTFCHSVAGTESHQHKALEQGCITCHDPHVSATKFLVKSDSVEQLCLSCHEVPLKRFAHRPFAQGECTLCHQPHQANNLMLLRGGEGANHCFTCHGNVRQDMARSRGVHRPALRDCAACHSPHSTDHPHLFSESIEQTCLSCHPRVQTQIQTATVPHAAVKEGASCLNCHAAHMADHKVLMRGRMDQVCLTCHDKPLRAADGHTIASMKPVLTQSQYLHGAIRAGDCSSCHRSHGAQEHSLLVRRFPDSTYARFDVKEYALCFETCHSSELVTAATTTTLTDFRDGETNLHFLHVNRDEKGRSCKTCHSVHGSNQPNHIASEVPFERSGWAMPIGYEKTSTGGSCAPGCHAPRTYDRGTAAAPTTAPSLRGVP